MKLTKTEEKILKAAAKSAGERLTVEQIAQTAGMSPAKIYEKLQNPEFRELFLAACKSSLAAVAPDVLLKFAELAQSGSFKHGKLVLEMAGLYKNEQKITADVGVHSTDKPFKTDEERNEWLKATFGAILEGEK